MRILAFVDVHGSLRAIEILKKKAKQADVLVCAGDISIFEQNLDDLVFRLNEFGKRVLMIPGNHETEEELEKICSRFKNMRYLHKKDIRMGGYLFIGYGGGGFALVDPEFEGWSKRYEKEKNLILITHAPPYKTKVDVVFKKHHGNESIKKFIDRAKPLMVICGHLHENEGRTDRVGETRVINPGPKGKLVKI